MKRWQIITGLVLIFLGLTSLLNLAFPNLRIGRFFFPLLLIGLGFYIILRPQISGKNVKLQFPIFGDLRNVGMWEVTQHEIWWLVGSNRLDFTDAVFPEGNGEVKIFGFVNDITIILPEDVGLHVVSSAFVNEYKGLQGKQERLLSILEDQSENYLIAQKKVLIQSLAFVSEIKVKPSLM